MENSSEKSCWNTMEISPSTPVFPPWGGKERRRVVLLFYLCPHEKDLTRIIYKASYVSYNWEGHEVLVSDLCLSNVKVRGDG